MWRIRTATYRSLNRVGGTLVNSKKRSGYHSMILAAVSLAFPESSYVKSRYLNACIQISEKRRSSFMYLMKRLGFARKKVGASLCPMQGFCPPRREAARQNNSGGGRSKGEG